MPDDMHTYLEKIMSFKKIGEKQKAENLARETIMKYYNRHEPRVLHAKLSMEDENWIEAHIRWCYVLRDFPNLLQAHIGSITAALRMNKLREIVNHVKQLRKVIQPSDLPFEYYKSIWESLVKTASCHQIDNEQMSTFVAELLSQPFSNTKHPPTCLPRLKHLEIADSKLFHEIKKEFKKQLNTNTAELTDTQLFTKLSLGFFEDDTDSKKLFFHFFENMNSFNFQVIFNKEKEDIIVSYFDEWIKKVLLSKRLGELSGEVIFAALLIITTLDKTDFLAQIKEQVTNLNQNNESESPAMSSVRQILASYSDHHNPPTITHTQTLRIAICVCGQLRGYKRAFESWNNWGMTKHSVDFYVHTWEIIGRKFPIGPQCSRVFSGNFLIAYQRIMQAHDAGWLKKNYPHLVNFIFESQRVSKEELSKTYNAKSVAVEDDQHNTFASYSNSMKMYYKTQCCFELLPNQGRDYNLIMRIRPDKVLHEELSIDWHKLAHESNITNTIFSDRGRELRPAIGYYMGDQVAVGVPRLMRDYCSTYDFSLNAKKKNLYGFQNYFSGHVNFAYTTHFKGINVKPLPMGWTDMIDAAPLALEDVYNNIMKDAQSRNSIEEDTLLLDACLKDFQEKAV